MGVDTQVIPALITLVLQNYVDFSNKKLGEASVKSLLFLTYKTEDPEALSEAQKYEFLLKLFDRNKEFFGERVARSDLEGLVKKIVERYGITKGYFELIEVLPKGVFDSEKVFGGAKGDVEERVTERTKELETVKEELSQRIAERTKELETERNKFRVVLYNAFDGVFALDKQKRVIAFNKTMEDLTGFLESEVLGKSVNEYVKLEDNEKKPVTSDVYFPLLKAFEDKSVYKAELVTLLGRSSKEHHVSLVSSIIADNQNSDVGCIVTLRDVTQQKELEVMKLDFVSIAAHELRTPLTAIRGYLSVLLSELSDKTLLNPDQMVYLERSFLSSNQLFTLVENLLNVSRIERGNVQLAKETMDWNTLAQQVVQSFEALAKERKVALSFTPIATATKVIVDPIMISEVMANIIDNALRYTSSGGTVHVFLEPRDKDVVTHVKDTGQGIPAESLPHLFSKFYRVSGVLEQGSKGTGLGLYISKEIVKLHGGEIWAESEIGKGSTFSFSVPRS